MLWYACCSRGQVDLWWLSSFPTTFIILPLALQHHHPLKASIGYRSSLSEGGASLLTRQTQRFSVLSLGVSEGPRDFGLSGDLNDGSIPSQILSILTLQLNKAINIQLVYHRNPHLTILPCHSISFETILQDCKDKNLPWEDFHNIHNLFQAHIQKVTMGSINPKTAISETGTLQVLLRKIKNKNNIPSHLLDAQNLLSAAIPYSLSLFTPESPHTQKLLTTLHPYIASTCIHTYLTSCTNQPPSPNSLLQILTHEHAFIHVIPNYECPLRYHRYRNGGHHSWG